MLAGATALLAQFYLGTQEQHDQAMAQHFWQELNLRFAFCNVIGLGGAGLWWGLNYGLLKSGFVQNINLRKMALLLIGGVVSGSLVGALLFCL
ncbi:MAG: hypothetical protein ACRYFZ_27340 [Janthinobacterium lividum]